MSAVDFTTLFIMLREGLEAALIVGILLAYLRQVGAQRHARVVWAGVAGAVLVSGGVLAALGVAGAEFEGTTEQVFEGGTMLFATGVLTWMVFWMMRQSRLIRGELQQGVDRALASGAAYGLALLAFFAVVREGVETALLLQAAAFAGGHAGLVGATVGLAGAISLGILIYAFGVRIDLRAFFRVTAVVLILFAAGLVAHAAHEFTEAGILSALVERVWSTHDVLDEQEGLGAILRALFGYADTPSLLEVVTYVGYLAIVVALSRTRLAGLRPLAAPAKKPA